MCKVHAVMLLLLACNKPEPAPPPPVASAAPKAPSYTLDVSAAPCKAGDDCKLTIGITTAPDFHVNKEYPYKFVPDDTPNVAYAAKQFSRESGDFTEQGEKKATLTVRFKPNAAGEAKIHGIYKLSVCSAETCQIEQPTIDHTVSVTASR